MNKFLFLNSFLLNSPIIINIIIWNIFKITFDEKEFLFTIARIVNSDSHFYRVDCFHVNLITRT